MQSFSDAGEKVLVKDYNSKGVWVCVVKINHFYVLLYNQFDRREEHVIIFYNYLLTHFTLPRGQQKENFIKNNAIPSHP